MNGNPSRFAIVLDNVTVCEVHYLYFRNIKLLHGHMTYIFLIKSINIRLSIVRSRIYFPTIDPGFLSIIDMINMITLPYPILY